VVDVVEDFSGVEGSGFVPYGLVEVIVI